MKRFLLFFIVNCALSIVSAFAVTTPPMPTADDSVAFSQADFHWRSLGKGAEVGLAELQLFGRPEVIAVIKYPMRRWKTSFVHAPRELSSTTDTLAIREGAAFAINGSYFNMREFTPVTFFSCNHEIVGRQDPSTVERSTGVVAVRGKKISIFRYDSTLVEQVAKRYTSAIQCGPLLLVDDVVQPFDVISFNTVNHPRSFIGTDRKGSCYMVVVDGRLKGNAEGATMWELLAIARWLGCSSALNLDGGGSSSLWTADEGTVNYPCDNHVFDHQGLRRIPNLIVVR